MTDKFSGIPRDLLLAFLCAASLLLSAIGNDAAASAGTQNRTRFPRIAPAAGPLAQVARPALAAGRCGPTYVIKAGDTLSAIARRCGVPTMVLAAANGLRLTSLIYPGQRLVIPASAAAGTGAGASCPNPYTVRSGDTLAAIGRRCGITPASLKKWNNLTSDRLRVGQVLVTRATVFAPAISAPGSAAPAATPLPHQDLSAPINPPPTPPIESTVSPW